MCARVYVCFCEPAEAKHIKQLQPVSGDNKIVARMHVSPKEMKSDDDTAALN